MSIEEIKKQKDGLDVLADINRYARLGRETITPEDEALFRWYGIYTQRPAEDGFFMVRTRIPGGDLTSPQLRKLADLANRFGDGLADVTVRQNIQYHWVRVENLPVILDELQTVGLSTTEACGDCVRNIINCPVSGVAHDELCDTTNLIREIDRFFLNNRDFSNLPRKFKIAATGCAVRCTYPEINDIGLFAVLRRAFQFLQSKQTARGNFSRFLFAVRQQNFARGFDERDRQYRNGGKLFI